MEIKLRLPNKEAHDAVATQLQNSFRETHQQENFFFDGAQGELSSQRMVLRCRFYNKDKRAIVTLKVLSSIVIVGIERQLTLKVLRCRFYNRDKRAIMTLKVLHSVSTTGTKAHHDSQESELHCHCCKDNCTVMILKVLACVLDSGELEQQQAVPTSLACTPHGSAAAEAWQVEACKRCSPMPGPLGGKLKHVSRRSRPLPVGFLLQSAAPS